MMGTEEQPWTQVFAIEELVHKIFEYLPLSSLFSVRAVCRLWDRVVILGSKTRTKACCYVFDGHSAQLFDPEEQVYSPVSRPPSPGISFLQYLSLMQTVGSNPSLVGFVELPNARCIDGCFWVGNPLTGKWKSIGLAPSKRRTASQLKYCLLVGDGEHSSTSYRIILASVRELNSIDLHIFDSTSLKWKSSIISLLDIPRNKDQCFSIHGITLSDGFIYLLTLTDGKFSFDGFAWIRRRIRMKTLVIRYNLKEKEVVCYPRGPLGDEYVRCRQLVCEHGGSELPTIVAEVLGSYSRSNLLGLYSHDSRKNTWELDSDWFESQIEEAFPAGREFCPSITRDDEDSYLLFKETMTLVYWNNWNEVKVLPSPIPNPKALEQSGAIPNSKALLQNGALCKFVPSFATEP